MPGTRKCYIQQVEVVDIGKSSLFQVIFPEDGICQMFSISEWCDAQSVEGCLPWLAPDDMVACGAMVGVPAEKGHDHSSETESFRLMNGNQPDGILVVGREE